MTSVRKRVLLVEDDLDTRETMHELFTWLGHETFTARTGAEALSAYQAIEPCVVFIDLGLPDMSGLEVARRLRQLAAERPLQLVALTGWSRPSDRANVLDAGMDLHMLKPVGLQALRSVVGRAPASTP